MEVAIESDGGKAMQGKGKARQGKTTPGEEGMSEGGVWSMAR